MPFAGFLLGVSILWVIVKLVTRDESLGFWNCLLWMLGVRVAGLIARLALGSHGLKLVSPDVAEVGGMIIGVGVLALILNGQGYSPKQVTTIIVILVVAQALPFVLAAALA